MKTTKVLIIMITLILALSMLAAIPAMGTGGNGYGTGSGGMNSYQGENGNGDGTLGSGEGNQYQSNEESGSQSGNSWAWVGTAGGSFGYGTGHTFVYEGTSEGENGEQAGDGTGDGDGEQNQYQGENGEQAGNGTGDGDGEQNQYQGENGEQAGDGTGDGDGEQNQYQGENGEQAGDGTGEGQQANNGGGEGPKRYSYQYQNEIDGAIEEEEVGGEITVEDDGETTETYLDGFQVQVRKREQNRMEFEVSGEFSEGKIVIMNMAQNRMQIQNMNQIRVLFDGEEVKIAQNMEEMRTSNQARYMFAMGSDGIQVMVKIPHFSTHTIVVEKMDANEPVVETEESSPINSTFAIVGIVVAAFIIIALVAGMLYARNRKVEEEKMYNQFFKETNIPTTKPVQQNWDNLYYRK